VAVREAGRPVAALCTDLRGFATRYPLFDAARFPALALTIRTYLPEAQREGHALLALVSLWIIAFDALVDEGTVDATEHAALVTRYGILLDGDGARGIPDNQAQHAEAADQLDAALREIGVRLAAHEPPTALCDWWRSSLRATMAAIVRQRELGRAGGDAPGYDAILPLLVDSVGVRPYLAVGAIIGREPGLAARRPALVALASECAVAIRLANDLRTWEKDEREGGINTLVALQSDLARARPGVAAATIHGLALSTLGERLIASRARCQASLDSFAEADETATGMVRLVEVVVGVYAADDFHTYPAPAGEWA